MTQMSFSGTLLQKTRLTADSATFRFSRPADYHFEAGQSFSITIPSPDGPLRHQFSHADSPAEPFTELTTRLTGSTFKNALDALPLGASADFRGPAGRFLFRRDEPRIAFLTGGIGVTPVRSMLRHLADTDGADRIAGQELVLFYGCMTEQGAVYGGQLQQFASALPGLRLVFVITEPGPGWTGRSGFITAAMVAEELAEPSEWLYYMSGPPAMITAMDGVTRLLGVPAERVVKESFAGYDT